jgi:hypothetical protein
MTDGSLRFVFSELRSDGGREWGRYKLAAAKPRQHSL